LIEKVDNEQRALTKGSANLCGKFMPRSPVEGALFNLIRGGFHGVKGKLCPIKVSEILVETFGNFWWFLGWRTLWHSSRRTVCDWQADPTICTDRKFFVSIQIDQ
jgi:hypothetical protein